MGRALLSGFMICLVTGPVWAQGGDNRAILGAGNEYLSAGAMAIRLGRYDEGIRLTTLGLERYQPSTSDRAAALSNLCAAHAAKGELDTALKHCDDALALGEKNWRAYSNRSYIYYLKGMYSQASIDLDAAAAINPGAEQVAQIRAMINERRLAPRVIMEDHQ